jgi:predicted Zn-dependent protease
MVDLVASAKAGVDQAMALAKNGKYTEALSLLQQKAAEVQTNPDAKKLIDDAIAQIKQMASDAAAKAATDKVGGMLGGVGK